MWRKSVRNKRILAICLAGMVTISTVYDSKIYVNAEADSTIQVQESSETTTTDSRSVDETIADEIVTETATEDSTPETDILLNETESVMDESVGETECSDELLTESVTEESDILEESIALAETSIEKENDLTKTQTITPNTETESTDISAYVTIKDGIITQYNATNIANISIPNEIGNETVVGIANEVFKNHSEIISVSLPNTLQKIGNNAFAGTSLGTNTELGSLTIPASVTEIGCNAFDSCTYLGSVVFEDVAEPTTEGISFSLVYGNSGFTFQNCTNLAEIQLSNNFVTIPSYFANGCSRLKTVKWGTNVTTIQRNAFYNCSALEEIDLSQTKVTEISNYAFNNCGSAKKVVFPNTLDRIGVRAFEKAALGTNTELGSLTIPSSITKMGYRAFAECTYLGSVKFMDVDSPTLEGIVFESDYGSSGAIFESCTNLNDIQLSNHFVTIPTYFAKNCKKLETVTWGSNIKTISPNAFEECISLQKIDLSQTKVTEIGNSAFYHCSSAIQVVFPNTLTRIGVRAFEGVALGTNTELGSLTIPSSLSVMGYLAFTSCTYLGSVVFEDIEVPTLEGIVFESNYGASGSTFENCTNLKNIRLSNQIVNVPCNFAKNCKLLETVTWGTNVKTILNNAFVGCISLQGLDLSQTKVTEISDSAFSGCISLKKVVFPNTLEKIGQYAFAESAIGTSTEPGSLTIPASVVNIGFRAFSDCKYLGSVVFENVEKTTVEGLCFYEVMGSSGYTFINCAQLETIRLSNHIYTIPAYFASNCPNLKQVVWGENLKELKTRAFLNCSSLESVDLSKTAITKIEGYAFEKCTSINKVSFPQTIEEIGSCAFINAALGSETATGTLVIPASITYIGSYAFSACKYLGNVVFEDVEKLTVEGVSLTENNGSVAATFMDCPNLVSIRTSNNMRHLPIYFAGRCPKLTSITLTASELTIDKGAFLVYVNNSSQKLATVVDGTAEAIQSYDWAADNRVLKQKYSVIFHSNLKEDKTITQAIPRDQLTALMRNPFSFDGYSFTGWNTNPNGSGKKYTDGAQVKNLAAADGTIHLYAQWKVKTFTLTLYGNGGKIGSATQKNLTLKYGDTYAEVLKNTPTFKGRSFAGWYTTKTEGGETYDWAKLTVNDTPILKLYAHWDTLSYQVILDANTTSTVKPGFVTTGKGVKVTASSGCIYDAEGEVAATIDSPYYGLSIEYGEYMTLSGAEYERAGYTLTGWATSPNGKGTKYANKSIMPLASGNLTLYAQWKRNTYSIRYNLNGGKNNSKNPKKYTVESNTLQLLAPTKTGSNFAGWEIEEGKQVSSIPTGSYGNITLTAKWEEFSYQVVYHGGNEYTSVTEPYTVENIHYSDFLDLIGAADHFTVSDEYAGKKSIVTWTTKENGKGTKYSLKKLYNKLTKTDGTVIDLYAVWDANSYPIQYELSGGTNHKNNPYLYTYNSKKAVSISSPTKTGYQFTGWEVSGEGATGFDKTKNRIAAGTTGHLVLTATWKPITFQVTLNKNNKYATVKTGITDKYSVTYDSLQTLDITKLYENPYFDLVGFNTKANGKGTAVEINPDGNIVLGNLAIKNNAKVTLYAQWKVHTYRINYINLNPAKTYDPNRSYYTQLRGVVNKNATTYTPTSKVKFSKPTCDGYKFDGWYKDAACTQKITEISKGTTGDVTVYAKWKEK